MEKKERRGGEGREGKGRRLKERDKKVGREERAGGCEWVEESRLK